MTGEQAEQLKKGDKVVRNRPNFTPPSGFPIKHNKVYTVQRIGTRTVRLKEIKGGWDVRFFEKMDYTHTISKHFDI